MPLRAVIDDRRGRFIAETRGWVTDFAMTRSGAARAGVPGMEAIVWRRAVIRLFKSGKQSAVQSADEYSRLLCIRCESHKSGRCLL